MKKVKQRVISEQGKSTQNPGRLEDQVQQRRNAIIINQKKKSTFKII